MEGGDYFTKTITALPSNGAFMYVHTKVYHQSESRADFFCLFVFLQTFCFSFKTSWPQQEVYSYEQKAVSESVCWPLRSVIKG